MRPMTVRNACIWFLFKKTNQLVDKPSRSDQQEIDIENCEWIRDSTSTFTKTTNDERKIRHGCEVIENDKRKEAKLSKSVYNLPDQTTHATFGFIHVIDLPTVGLCGGLLIVSHLGRPLEFHCTAPCPPNRAQQIMYGETYRGFVFTDQIGAALVDSAKHLPSAYLTCSPDMLPIGELVDPPVVLAEILDTEKPFDGSGVPQFKLGDIQFSCVNLERTQTETLRWHIEKFHSKLPVDEPFERISQAIEEAHAVLRAA